MKSFYKDHFGGEHYSPSTLSVFSACPGIFLLNKCFKFKSSVGAAAHRGSSCELGIFTKLTKPNTSLDEAISITTKEFVRLMALSSDPNRDKEQAALAGIVEEGLKMLEPYGVPDSYQERVEYHHPDLPLPIIGFTDFSWSKPKVVIDLKTQLRLASEIAQNHARQVSLYQTCKGPDWTAGVCYTTPKKGHILQVENAAQHLDALVRMAKNLENFCSISDDPMVLAGIIAPDFDSFYWNEPAARKEAFKIWGY